MQLFSPTGSKVGSEIVVSATSILQLLIYKQQSNPVTCVLTGGNFAITFISQGLLTGLDIYYVIYNSSGGSVKGQAQANSSSAGTQNSPAIAALTNGGFVIIWIDQNSNSAVMGQVFTSSGSSSGSEFQVNDPGVTMTCSTPQLVGLSNGGFVVTWSGVSSSISTGADIYFKAYDNTFSPLATTNNLVNSSTANDQTYPSVISFSEGFIITWISADANGNPYYVYAKKYDNLGEVIETDRLVSTEATISKADLKMAFLSNKSFVVTWDGNSSGNVDIYKNIIPNTLPQCTDKTLIMKPSTTVSLNFTSNASDAEDPDAFLKVQFNSLPSVGSILDGSGSAVSLNTPYSLTELTYSGSTNGAYSAIFQTMDTFQTLSSTCTLTIEINSCYISCASCQVMGNATDNQCLTCNESNGYYPLSDKTSQCPNSAPTGYYLNSTDPSNIQYKPCYSSCATCSQGGDATNNNCDTCLTNYFFVSGTSNCKTDPQDGYYLDLVTNTLKPCYSSCKSCFTSSTDPSNQKCITCISNFYQKFDNPYNCYDINNIPDYYYFNSSQSLYMSCYSSCLQCSGPGNSTDNQCQTCKSGYYPESDHQSNCFSTTPPGYYLDTSTDYYTPCYFSCNTCDMGGNATRHNCTQCKDNFYWMTGEATNCYNSTPAGYFYSPSTNSYLSCYQSCETCTDSGTYSSQNCASCKAGYYSTTFSSSQCYSSTPVNYYFDTTLNKYALCDSSTTNFNLNPNAILTISSFTPSVIQSDSSMNAMVITVSGNLYESNPLRSVSKVSFVSTDGKTTVQPSIISIHCNQIAVMENGSMTAGFYYVDLTDQGGNTIKSSNKLQVVNSAMANATTLTQIENDVTGKIISTLNEQKDIYPPIMLQYNNTNTTVQIANTSQASEEDLTQMALANNLSLVDFSQCEEVLKNYYHIPSNENLIFAKVDQKVDGSNKVNLIVYDQEGNKLNINLCKNTDIIYSFPSKLNMTLAKEYLAKGIDIYDPNSKFYNDICFPFSANGTDLTLNDRRNELFPNISVSCSAGCSYTGIDVNTGYVQCSCNGTSNTNVSQTYLESALDDLIQNNFYVITCLAEVFQKTNITTNYGFFFMSLLMVLATSISTFVGCYYNSLSAINLLEIVKFDATRFQYSNKLDMKELPSIRDSSDKKEESENEEEDEPEIEQDDNFKVMEPGLVGNPPGSYRQSSQSFHSSEDEENIATTPKISRNPTASTFQFTRQNIKFKRSTGKDLKAPSQNALYKVNIHKNGFFTEEQEVMNNGVDVIVPHGKFTRPGFKPNTVKEKLWEIKEKANPQQSVKKLPVQKIQVASKKNLEVIKERSLDLLDKINKKNPNNNNGMSSVRSLFRHDSGKKESNNNTIIIHERRDSELEPVNELLRRGGSCSTKTMPVKNQDSPSFANFKPPESSAREQQLNQSCAAETKFIENKSLTLVYTFTDYNKMKFEQILQLDTRPFCTYYWDLLISNHTILSVLYKKSLMRPLSIRIFALFYGLGMDFAMNAVFYTDKYISERHNMANSQNLNFIYTFLYEFPKSLWAFLMTALMDSILDLILDPRDHVEEEFNESLVTGDLHKISEANKVYQKDMKCRYSVYFTVAFFIYVFMWLFVLCFCGIFEKSQFGWLQGGIITTLLRVFGMELFIPLLRSINRSISIAIKSKCLYEFNFLVQALSLLVS